MYWALMFLLGTGVACRKSTSTEAGPEHGPFAGTLLYLYANLQGTFDLYALDPERDSLWAVVATVADEKYPLVVDSFLYFAANDSGSFDIYRARLDGTGRVRLTRAPGDEVEPAVSPSGAYLAYASGGTGGYQIAVYDLVHDSLMRVLGNASSYNVAPTFVGSDTLLMTLQDFGGVYSQDGWMYWISRDTLWNVLATPSTQESQWRVWGSHVVFARKGLYGEDPHIVMADFPGFTQEVRLYSNAVTPPVRPIWDPTGRYVAVGHEGRCLIVAVDTRTLEVDTLLYRNSGTCYPYDWK
ncbi:MAG: hypothetical protein L3J76_01945 [Candidatus Hydrothermae bacterium]|nr:hypothetical protein [Candidatus Hydrothermae bacterium]